MDKKAFYVATADFVSLEEGVGIVHTAAMYGEDDYRLAQEIKLPLVEMLNDQGKFLDFVTPLAGVFYKKAKSWIVDDLTTPRFNLSEYKHHPLVPVLLSLRKPPSTTMLSRPGL